jgi:hypothetical protein
LTLPPFSFRRSHQRFRRGECEGGGLFSAPKNRLGRQHLTRHQPIKQHADTGQMLLNAARIVSCILTTVPMLSPGITKE